jgi:cation diffusion facilitator family transporter
MAKQLYQRVLQVSVVGFFVNAGLAAVKLVGGLIGNSTALIADAVESLTDVVSSLIVLGGLRVAAQPPDRNHPYGHGRAESLAALIVGLMLVGAGIGVAFEAISSMLEAPETPAGFTLWVLLGVVAVKEIMYQLARRAARVSDSSLGLADAWHHRSDAITSLVAAGGIGVALWGGERFAVADDWVALFAAGVIVFNASRVLRPPLHELMDKRPSQIIRLVREVAESVGGVEGVEKVFARKIGPQYWVDMHIEVDPDMPVRRAHDVSHDVKDAIRAASPNVLDVLVHIEPYHPDGRPDGAALAPSAAVAEPSELRK